MRKLFISYSHKDENHRNDLETMLTILKRNGSIETWSDRKILPGQKWENEISSQLENSDVILFLISPDFIASEYCYEIEMKKALEKHDKNEAIIIPIVVRPCAWQLSLVSGFQVLPYEGKAITTWENVDEAWLNVTNGISKICDEFKEQKSLTIPSLRKVAEKIERKANEVLKIGIFGQTGVGKSSICNGLFGDSFSIVSDVSAGTRSIQEFQVNENIILLDFPGIGESIHYDVLYKDVYNKYLKEIDLVLWVISAPNRALRDDQIYINELQKRELLNGDSFYVILNKVDLIFPHVDWNHKEKEPSRSQGVNIERKILYLTGLFGVPASKIIPVSALMDYNIEELARIINEKLNQKVFKIKEENGS